MTWNGRNLGQAKGWGNCSPGDPSSQRKLSLWEAGRQWLELECLSLASFSLHQPFTSPLHPTPNRACFFPASRHHLTVLEPLSLPYYQMSYRVLNWPKCPRKSTFTGSHHPCVHVFVSITPVANGRHGCLVSFPAQSCLGPASSGWATQPDHTRPHRHHPQSGPWQAPPPETRPESKIHLQEGGNFIE